MGRPEPRLQSKLLVWLLGPLLVLLVLDTAVEDGASALYEQLGFTLTGVIPDYALKPHGGLTGTMVYWKRIGNA